MHLYPRFGGWVKASIFIGMNQLTKLLYDILSKFHDFEFEILVSAESADKLAMLKEQGRDFTKVNDKLRQEFVDGVTAYLNKAKDLDAPDVADKAIKAGCLSVRDHIYKRISDGAEYSMPALKSSTIKAKGSSKIGVDSGKLKADLRNANVKILK